MTREAPPSPRRLLAGALALVVALTAAFGVGGLLLAIGLTVGWYLLPVTYAIAGGSLLVLALAPTSLSDTQLVAVVASFLALLAVATPTDDRPIPALAALGLGAGGLLGATWVGLAVGDAVWAGALVLALAFAVASYGLHRYELVQLGLVEDTDA